MGINQNDIPMLFNKFSMLQKHLKFNACGSGIGLSISKMIVESLDGEISVNSEEGAWTEFTFNVKFTENVQNNLQEESKLSNIQELNLLHNNNNFDELSPRSSL